MAFTYSCTSSGNSFTIALQDSRSIEKQFAEGYSRAKLASFASSEDNFHQSFFVGKPASHALIADVALNGRCVFNTEDLDVVIGAIEALVQNDMVTNPVCDLLQNAKAQIETNGAAIYQTEVTSKYAES